MDKKIKDEIRSLTEELRRIQEKLAVAVAQYNAQLFGDLKNGKEQFNAEIIKRHKELRVGLWKYIRGANIWIVLTAPIIYGVFPVFVVVDIAMTVYQHICFRVYNIPRVRRSDYLVFERSGLPYLNAIQKLNCAYCSYGNGIIAYALEIASRTERYWCPVKHAKLMTIRYHEKYDDFADFGDVEEWKKKCGHSDPEEK